MSLLTILGAKYLIILSVLLFMWLLRTLPASERRQMIILGIVALPLAYILAKCASYLYFDPRPFVVGNFVPLVPHAPDNGFPSDHTLFAAALAALATRFSWKYGLALWVLAVLVGVSRVAAGVHHTVDVIGAIVIAAVAVVLVAYLLQKRVRI